MSLISCVFSTLFTSFLGKPESYPPTKLNQKSFNASMSEQSVQTVFDNLISNQSDIVLNNYSTIYFSNLNDNYSLFAGFYYLSPISTLSHL